MRIFFCLSFLLYSVMVSSQKLTVESFSVAQGNLSASVNVRNDRNGVACGLVKVQLAATGAEFEGSVVGDVSYKLSEYWVYMTQGAYLLQVRCPGFLPLDINLHDHGLKDGVQPKVTYKLVVNVPIESTADNKEGLLPVYEVSMEEIRDKSDEDIAVLAYEYMSGKNGKAKDYIKAATFSRVAAEHGNLLAQTLLGICFDNGLGVNKDYDQALFWFQKASDENSPRALFCLGLMYYNGHGVAIDYEKAFAFTKKAAEAGLAGAERSLGYDYYLGHGTQKNYSLAIEWYKKAADKGLNMALNDIGNIYYKGGYGIMRDFAKAVDYYTQASEKEGGEWGIVNLGMCYEQGKGVVTTQHPHGMSTCLTVVRQQ